MTRRNYRWRSDAPISGDRLTRHFAVLGRLDEHLAEFEADNDTALRDMTIYVEGVEWFTEAHDESLGDFKRFLR